MSNSSSWLPTLIFLEEYKGDWKSYMNAIYEYFRADFIDDKPTFRGVRLSLKRYPLSNGKEATFWHLISEGDREDERLIDIRRCERIRWPRPIIEKADDSEVKVWKNTRRSETRICLWAESSDYLVVLAIRKKYILLWTAYVVDLPHRRKKLRKEYEEFQIKPW